MVEVNKKHPLLHTPSLPSLLSCHSPVVTLHLHTNPILTSLTSFLPYHCSHSPLRFAHPDAILSSHTLPIMFSLPLTPHHPLPTPSHFPPPSGVLCPIPILPLDGEVSWSSREVGEALHYSCSEGFNLVGTASQECLSTGEWSSSTPLCMQGESLGGAVSECFSTNVSVCFL